MKARGGLVILEELVALNKLKMVFFKYLDNEIDITEVLIFIFEHDVFRITFNQDDYADLFSIKSNELGNRYELSKTLFKYFNVAEYETHALKRRLNEVKNNPHKLPHLLKELYSLYCSGYAFLGVLGLGWELTYDIEEWESFNVMQREEWVKNNYPKIIAGVDLVLKWFADGKIILLNEYNEFNCLEYIDKRTETKKRKVIYKANTKGEGLLKKIKRFIKYLTP